MTNPICVKAWISGRVQGVSYRAHTQRQARHLNLTGYARNLADGRVEVLACGEAQQVEQLLAWLHQGSPHSEVKNVITEFQAWQPHSTFTTG